MNEHFGGLCSISFIVVCSFWSDDHLLLCDPTKYKKEILKFIAKMNKQQVIEWMKWLNEQENEQSKNIIVRLK